MALHWGGVWILNGMTLTQLDRDFLIFPLKEKKPPYGAARACSQLSMYNEIYIINEYIMKFVTKMLALLTFRALARSRSKKKSNI